MTCPASKAGPAAVDAKLTRKLNRMKVELIRGYVGTAFALACVKYTHW